jgi:hypothetical protein
MHCKSSDLESPWPRNNRKLNIAFNGAHLILETFFFFFFFYLDGLGFLACSHSGLILKF